MPLATCFTSLFNHDEELCDIDVFFEYDFSCDEEHRIEYSIYDLVVKLGDGATYRPTDDELKDWQYEILWAVSKEANSVYSMRCYEKPN